MKPRRYGLLSNRERRKSKRLSEPRRQRRENSRRRGRGRRLKRMRVWKSSVIKEEEAK